MEVLRLKSALLAQLQVIYINKDSEHIAQHLLSTCEKQTASCTVADAFLNESYKAGTWVALLVMFWHEMVGNNAIMLYSNKMLDQMSKGGSALSPR